MTEIAGTVTATGLLASWIGGSVAATGVATSIDGTVAAETRLETVDPVTGARSGILAAGYQRVGARVEIDLGAGFEVVQRRQLDRGITLEESLDNISGGDRAEIGLHGTEYLPLIEPALRGKAPIRITGIQDAGGGTPDQRVVFRGRAWQAIGQINPPLTRITALDSASEWADALIEWSELPGHGKTRREVVTAILDAYAVPIGEVSLGPLGDTPCAKGIAEGGTRKLFEFISEYVMPCGALVSFDRAGRFRARRIIQPSVPVRTLRPREISDFGGTITPPSTDTPNVVIVTATRNEIDPASGLRTVVGIYEERAIFSVPQATVVQHGDGTQEDLETVDNAAERVLRRVTTRTTYRGRTRVRVDIDTEEWFSPLAAPRHLANGEIVEKIRPDFFLRKLYQHADGSWRKDQQLRFQLVSRSIWTVEEDDAGLLTLETTRVRSWGFHRAAVARIVDGDEATITTDAHSGVYLDGGSGLATIAITETGEGVTYPFAEYGLRDVITKRTTADEGNQISTVTTRTWFVGFGPQSAETTEGAWVYGTKSKQYARFGTEKDFAWGENTLIADPDSGAFVPIQLGGLSIRDEIYAPDEEPDGGYTLIVTERINRAGAQGAGDYDARNIRTVEGPRPYVNGIEASWISTALESEARDEFRITRNGEVVVSVHNEWCENENETAALVVHLLREISKIPIDLDLPFEWLTHKGEWLRVDIPAAGLVLAWLHVWRCVRTLGDDFRLSLQAHYYPPEVA